MEQLDRQFLELRRQKKREAYQSFETGFYIQNNIVQFKRVPLDAIAISIMLPTTFVKMPHSMAKVKYPSVNRPQIIMTSLDTGVNFTFTKIDHQVRPEQLKSMADQMQAAIQRTNPACVFFEKQMEETDSGWPVSWFDYKGYALDEHVYCIMYLLPLKTGQVLHGTFSCVYGDREEWKKAAHQALLSICEESEDV